MEIEELTSNYFEVLTEWEIARAHAMEGLETKDERESARVRFMLAHEKDYRDLMKAHTDLALEEASLTRRTCAALEGMAEAQTRISESSTSAVDAVEAVLQK